MATPVTQAANIGYRNIKEHNQVVIGPGAQTPANVAGVMTGVAVLTGDRVLANGATTSLSFQNTWTGTPTGAFTYQGSNDADPDNAPIAGWMTVVPDVVGAAPAGGASGNVSVFKVPPMRWYRQIYTNTGGVGVLVSIAEGKGA
jgi:hypothetical protein